MSLLPGQTLNLLWLSGVSPATPFGGFLVPFGDFLTELPPVLWFVQIVDIWI